MHCSPKLVKPIVLFFLFFCIKKKGCVYSDSIVEHTRVPRELRKHPDVVGIHVREPNIATCDYLCIVPL